MTRLPFRRSASQTDPAAGSSSDRAFELLARRSGLRRHGVETLLDLAGHIDAPPIALLISEHAFLCACVESERTARSQGGEIPRETRDAIADLRDRLFATP